MCEEMIAMARPREIDLDQYGIGYAILYMFQAGGGQCYINNVQEFWNEVATSKPLRLKLALDGASIWIDQNVRVIVESASIVMQLAFAFTIVNNGSVVNVSVALNNDTTGNCNVMVKIT